MSSQQQLVRQTGEVADLELDSLYMSTVSGMIWYPVSSSSQCQYGRQMRGGQYCGIWIRATGETQGDFLG